MDQETSKEGQFIKTRQIAQHQWIDSSTATQQLTIYQDLMSEARQILDRSRLKLDTFR